MTKRIGVCSGLAGGALLVLSGLILANNGVISVIGNPNPVNTSTASAYRWEPSSAVGTTTWATAWAEIPTTSPTKDSYVSVWGGSWGSQQLLRTPGGVSLGDVNLSWDSLRTRFVLDAIEVGSTITRPNVWYAYSTNSNGTSWTGWTSAFSGNFANCPAG